MVKEPRATWPGQLGLCGPDRPFAPGSGFKPIMVTSFSFCFFYFNCFEMHLDSNKQRLDFDCILC